VIKTRKREKVESEEEKTETDSQEARTYRIE
jgi:hypothetical protein